MKRKGKLWIRIFPDKSVTLAAAPKPGWVKAKASQKYWVATVRPGNVLFELDGVPESIARESFAPGRGQAAGTDQVPHPPPRRGPNA